MIKILDYNTTDKSSIFMRTNPCSDVCDIVSKIIADVKENGDEALFRYEKKFDCETLDSLEVSKKEIDDALANTDSNFIRILKRAAKNIKKFHEKQIRSGFMINDESGVVIGQKVIAMSCVGLYVPGGTAAYPSTVLMDAIPAKLAGCKNIIMVTPPGKDGKINPAILAAASIAGIDKIYKLGGAQAIAALAYGTKTIPKADKIVGPGNAFVAEAKKQVFGLVSIDMIAGPSEILIISDSASDAKVIAADMLSQAEHDKNASAVLITTSPDSAAKVAKEIERQLSCLERAEIARASIDNNSKIIIADSIETAISISNEIAPEHLELFCDNPFDYLDKIENAGSVFMGKNCPEALGDYLAGTNHTLPTGGSAKFSSPLSVDDFVKKTQYTYYTRDALKNAAEDIYFFANKEGLGAHAKSAVVRFEDDK